MITRRAFLALPILGARSRLWSQTDLMPQYRFESSPWPNLHHFLYVLARARNGTPDSTRVAVSKAPLDDTGFASLSPEERKAWDDAVRTYQKDAVPLGIEYGKLVDVNYAVADLDGWAPISQAHDVP